MDNLHNAKGTPSLTRFLCTRDFQTSPDVRIAVVSVVPVELHLAVVGVPIAVRDVTIRKRFSAFFFLCHQILCS